MQSHGIALFMAYFYLAKVLLKKRRLSEAESVIIKGINLLLEEFGATSQALLHLG